MRWLVDEDFRRSDAVAAGHVDIHEDDVRQEPADLLDPGISVQRRRDDVNVVLEAEKLAEVIERRRDVIDDDDPDR